MCVCARVRFTLAFVCFSAALGLSFSSLTRFSLTLTAHHSLTHSLSFLKRGREGGRKREGGKEGRKEGSKGVSEATHSLTR